MNWEFCRVEKDKISNVCVICFRVCFFLSGWFGVVINVVYDYIVGFY